VHISVLFNDFTSALQNTAAAAAAGLKLFYFCWSASA